MVRVLGTALLPKPCLFLVRADSVSAISRSQTDQFISRWMNRLARFRYGTEPAVHYEISKRTSKSIKSGEDSG